MDLDQVLDVAVRAVRQAGQLAQARLGQPGYWKWKGHRDPVLHASVEVQDVICARLREAFPDHAMLAEEGPEDEPVPVDAEHLWIVDPICGSLNFAKGIPYFGVCAALRSAGAIVVGVVYDPCRDELFAATVDRPATLNGQPIRVQPLVGSGDGLAHTWLGTDWPNTDERRSQAFEIAALMAPEADLAVMGSLALGICNVAAGRLHAYWHLDARVWDVAAAGLILQRAGGTRTDAAGMSWLQSDGDYVASNGVIHEAIVRRLAIRATQPRQGRP